MFGESFALVHFILFLAIMEFLFFFPWFFGFWLTVCIILLEPSSGAKCGLRYLAFVSSEFDVHQKFHFFLDRNLLTRKWEMELLP